MKRSIDLNSDLGEGAGFDDELLSLVSSANIACGFHAGDAHSMKRTISAAGARNVAIGAHPSLFDRENFGRTESSVTPEQVFDAVAYQLGVFQAIAEAVGARVRHVKPHGALYNMAAREVGLAAAIVRAISEADQTLLLFAPGGSALDRAGRSGGIRVVTEVFADRNYLNDGSLVPRTRPDALLADPVAAAKRVIRILRDNKVQSVDGKDVSISAETICLHGDTPGAVEFARTLRRHLEAEGIEIRAPDR
ncbi:MAG TPA: 5-oxoprolinase subunit PxpA [Chthoniobacterales bacterium]|nr:5-oxoprolinase subunit PxpA [Chthoniobacterales bacterium]